MKVSEMFGPLPPDPPALLTALELLSRGFWTIPITAPDDARASAPGKQPIGQQWGLTPHTRESLRAAWLSYPKAGVGLKLGKDAGYIDVEVDDPSLGAETMARLFGGEVVDTMGWTSTRGEHHLFRWDDRLARYGKPILKVRTGFDLPGVEIRIGAMNGDGKQFQSVCPPSSDTEGRPRLWNPFRSVAQLPDAFFEYLDRLMEVGRKPKPAPATIPFRGNGADNARSRYGLAALDREVAALESSPEGGRNDQLNKSAFALGQLVASGCLVRSDVEAVLREVAGRIGLNEKETEATIRSGMGAGVEEPRDVEHVGKEVIPKASGSKKVKGEEQVPPPVEWEAPVLDVVPPAMPFPLEVLPPELGFLVYEGAQCLTCPPDFLGVTALTIAGAAIGRTLAIKVKESWSESPTVYAAIVARPGSTKSSALALVSKPLWILSEELMAQYKRDLQRHKQEQAQPDSVPEPAPVLGRVVVNDTTCEALAPILADNPHGLVMVRDELTAWVAGLNQYKTGGKGSDRQFFLSTWSGSPVTVDRKSQGEAGPIHIPHPFLCVVGALTPDMLGELADEKGRDDGFIDRLLFAYPDPVRIRWNPGSVSEESIEAWTQAVRRLHARPMVEDARGHPCPFFARMAPDAVARYAEWHDLHEKESEQDDFPRHLTGVWSKLKAYCARFALILDQLHRVYDPTDDGSDVTIRLASLERAIRLAAYFKDHCRRVRSMLRGGSNDNPDARAVLKWIVRSKRAEFSERDARLNFPGRFRDHDADLKHALSWLKSRHCIREMPRPTPSAKGGRPPTARFEVNPALLAVGFEELKTLLKGFDGNEGDDAK